MFEYIAFVFLVFLYQLDVHNIIYTRAIRDYNRLKRLQSLVSTQHSNIRAILWVSMCIILKTIYINFLQFINKNLRKIGKNKYELSYVVNGKLYKMILYMNRGPRKIIQALDDDDVDITDTLQEYAGCSEDFHKLIVTPHLIGKKSVTLYLSSGYEKIFEEHDPINY